MVVGLFVFDLMAGMVAINIGPAAWQWWVDLQRNPLNLLLTVLALAAAAIHTVPWFQLTPSIIKVLKVHPPEVVRMAGGLRHRPPRPGRRVPAVPGRRAGGLNRLRAAGIFAPRPQRAAARAARRAGPRGGVPQIP